VGQKLQPDGVTAWLREVLRKNLEQHYYASANNNIESSFIIGCVAVEEQDAYDDELDDQFG